MGIELQKKVVNQKIYRALTSSKIMQIKTRSFCEVLKKNFEQVIFFISFFFFSEFF